jgi:hypothetical protein
LIEKAEEFKAEHGEEVKTALYAAAQKAEDLVLGASAVIKSKLLGEDHHDNHNSDKEEK